MALTHTASVAYFADGTPYVYHRDGMTQSTFNVGWLDEAEPYPIGPVPTEFVRRLITLTQNPVMLMRGWHECDLCPRDGWQPHDPSRALCRFEGEEWSVFGNGEIRVAEPNGTCWAAPRLVVHYVLAHGYLPPAGFLGAVLTGRTLPDPSQAWREEPEVSVPRRGRLRRLWRA